MSRAKGMALARGCAFCTAETRGRTRSSRATGRCARFYDAKQAPCLPQNRAWRCAPSTGLNHFPTRHAPAKQNLPDRQRLAAGPAVFCSYNSIWFRLSTRVENIRVRSFGGVAFLGDHPRRGRCSVMPALEKTSNIERPLRSVLDAGIFRLVLPPLRRARNPHLDPVFGNGPSP